MSIWKEVEKDLEEVSEDWSSFSIEVIEVIKILWLAFYEIFLYVTYPIWAIPFLLWRRRWRDK